jgi:peptide-methionine (S)-S-oxide reductase
LSRQEASFAKLPGVVKTRVGYTGGSRPNPTYESVCAGDGHTEAMRVWFDPTIMSYEDLLKVSIRCMVEVV